jgi:hypothetical protein
MCIQISATELIFNKSKYDCKGKFVAHTEQEQKALHMRGIDSPPLAS